MQHAIPLSEQLELFKEYKTKLAKVAGQKKADSIIKDALYLLGAGSGDFVQNYYINPLVNKVYTVDQYSNFLVSSFTSFIQVFLLFYRFILLPNYYYQKIKK